MQYFPTNGLLDWCGILFPRKDLREFFHIVGFAPFMQSHYQKYKGVSNICFHVNNKKQLKSSYGDNCYKVNNFVNKVSSNSCTEVT